MRTTAKDPPSYGGIDPGREGYLVRQRGKRLLNAWPIPHLAKGKGNRIDRLKLLAFLREWKRRGCARIYLEHQQSFGREGVASVWTAAENFGVLKMALDAAGFVEGVDWFEVRPGDWKARMNLLGSDPAKGLERVPRPPAKGASAGEIDRWQAEKLRITKLRQAARKAEVNEVKELATNLARRLAPGVDFRATEKSKVPHVGKVEGYLLAVCAEDHQQ